MMVTNLPLLKKIHYLQIRDLMRKADQLKKKIKYFRMVATAVNLDLIVVLAKKKSEEPEKIEVQVQLSVKMKLILK